MNFNAFTFVPFLIQQFGRIDHLCAALYSVSQELTVSLCQMLDSGSIGRIDLLVSRTLTFRFPKRLKEITEAARLRPDRFRVGVAQNHSKIALMRCGDNHFCVEGSGNWCHNDKDRAVLLRQQPGGVRISPRLDYWTVRSR